MLIVYCALALAVMLGVATLAAAAPEDIDLHVELSDLQAARILFQVGRFAHAKEFLERAQPANEDEQIERLFLLGLAELRLRLPEKAAESFEAILALRPWLTRVRLELAQAHYMSGRDDRARENFVASLEDKLPSSVKRAVEGFLRRIDGHDRWSAFLSATMLPETRRPKRESVLIGGIPFRLDEDARGSSGSGTLVSAGVSFSPKVGKRQRGVLGASVAAKLYRRSGWNDITTSGDIGLAHPFDGGIAAGGARLERRWIGGEGYLHGLGPWLRMRWTGHRSIRFDAELSADYRIHDSVHGRNGWRIAASPRLVYAPDGRTSIEAEPLFEIVNARQDHHGSRLAGFEATVSRAFEKGFFLSLSPSAEVRRHSARDPLFGKVRVDRSLRLGVRLLHRSVRYRGFAPYVGISIERTRSNIPIYNSRGHGIIAGVTRTF